MLVPDVCPSDVFLKNIIDVAKGPALFCGLIFYDILNVQRM